MKKSKKEEFVSLVTDKSVYRLLGLCMRQRAVESGSFLAEQAVKSKSANLVIVAEDASDNTKKMFRDMCTYYKVPIHIFGNKNELGHAIGKEFRASLALTNKGLSEKISEQIDIIQANEAMRIQGGCNGGK